MLKKWVYNTLIIKAIPVHGSTGQVGNTDINIMAK